MTKLMTFSGFVVSLKILLRSTSQLILFAFFFSTIAFATDFEQGRQAFLTGNFAKALEIWQPLAQSGNAHAQHALGIMNEYGRGLQRNDEEAAKWFEKAAEQNIPDAQYRLGVLYENGWGVARDADKAAQLYKQAAEQGHVFAQHDLAFMHVEGKGVPVDQIEAYKWLRIASVYRGEVMMKHLASVSQTMSEDDISQAEKLADEWLQSRN